MDISEDNVIAHIRCYDNFTDNTYEWGPPSFPEATENVSLLETCNAAGLVHRFTSESQHYQGYI
jgi:hypothetical protein